MLTEALAVSPGPLSIEGVEFNSVNLLSSLKSIQTQPETLSRRNDISAQLLATTSTKLLDKIGDNLINYIVSFSQSAEAKDLQWAVFEANLSKVLKNQTRPVKNSDTYFRVSIDSDPRYITPNKLPSVGLATQATVNADLSVSFRTKLKFPSIENISEANVCMPTSVANLQVANFPVNRVRIADINGERCVFLNIVNETEADLVWNTAIIATSSNSQYNLTLGLYKQPGLVLVSDYEIKVAAGLKVQSTTPAINLEANQTIFTETMTADRFINILLSR
jgi:hypothetical protein